MDEKLFLLSNSALLMTPAKRQMPTKAQTQMTSPRSTITLDILGEIIIKESNNIQIFSNLCNSLTTLNILKILKIVIVFFWCCTYDPILMIIPISAVITINMSKRFQLSLKYSNPFAINLKTISKLKMKVKILLQELKNRWYRGCALYTCIAIVTVFKNTITKMNQSNLGFLTNFHIGYLQSLGSSLCFLKFFFIVSICFTTIYIFTFTYEASSSDIEAYFCLLKLSITTPTNIFITKREPTIIKHMK